ncbi:MAG TPA: hypothetical protein PLN69_10670 [bacterium]|nr:hypothetical protein [bacterium]
MLKTDLEIAGIHVLISAPGDNLPGRFSGICAAGEPANPALTIDYRVAESVNPGSGISTSGTPGSLSFDIQGISCELDLAERKGKLVTVNDDTVLEYALKVAFQWLLIHECGSIIHAAGLIKGKRGYAFAGPPGAGKSTLASLAPGEPDIVNDEHVAIIREDDSVTLHPLPAWASPDRNPAPPPPAPLSAFFAIAHGESESMITGVTAAEQTRRIFENMVFLPPEINSLGAAMDTADRIRKIIPVARLDFALPDRENLWNGIEQYLENKISKSA